MDNPGLEMDSVTVKDDHIAKVTPEEDNEERLLQKDLEHHFSAPYTRCFGSDSCVRSTPRKLIVLVLKWAFFTAQLMMFGSYRADFGKFINSNDIAMKNLLLKDWITGYETMPYPPITGQYAVYSIDDLISHINYTVNQVYALPTTSVGSFFVTGVNNSEYPVKICVTSYSVGKYNYVTQELTVDLTRKTDCQRIGHTSPENYNLNPTIPDLINSVNGTLVRLLKVDLEFSIDSIHIDMNTPTSPTGCFRINGLITFDNFNINGQIPVSLKTAIEEFTCGSKKRQAKAGDLALFVIILLLSTVSALFSSISFVGSVLLCKRTQKFFEKTQGAPLSRKGIWEILKCRDLVIVVSDILTLSGSIMKYKLDTQTLSSSSDLYDVCGILLGIGCLLVWFGVLHYLAYDKGFNLLFLVMEQSFFPVIRFLTCSFLLYISFSLCGWVVLGPYHLKFLSLFNTFRCLFGLINGDEIYVTLAAVADEDTIAWWFNAFFITTYIIIFTLVTLNIVISIFNATYDNIRNGITTSDLSEFMGRKSLYRCRIADCHMNCCGRKTTNED